APAFSFFLSSLTRTTYIAPIYRTPSMRCRVVTVKPPGDHQPAPCCSRAPVWGGEPGGAAVPPARARPAPARSATAPVPSHGDYAIARRAVLRDLRRGSIGRRDVCDAPPELLRAGRNVGERAPHDCPVCARERVRFVSYVSGDSLKQANGRCITN